MRKLFGTTIAAACLAAACGGSPNGPTTPSTQAPTAATVSGPSQGGADGSGSDHGSQPPPPTTSPQPQPPQPEPEPEPQPEPEREFTGVIAGLSGSPSSFQFTVGSTVVKGDATTAITRRDLTVPFSTLQNGLSVEVKGMQQTGFVQAASVHVEDEIENEPPEPPNDNDDDEVKVEGTLGAMTGTCPAISSSVSTTKFTTSASTRFDDPCGGFHAGDRVEVRGTRTASGALAATRLRKRN